MAHKDDMRLNTGSQEQSLSLRVGDSGVSPSRAISRKIDALCLLPDKGPDATKETNLKRVCTNTCVRRGKKKS